MLKKEKNNKTANSMQAADFHSSFFTASKSERISLGEGSSSQMINSHTWPDSTHITQAKILSIYFMLVAALGGCLAGTLGRGANGDGRWGGGR